jgi:MATE family multidrug resistance protein
MGLSMNESDDRLPPCQPLSASPSHTPVSAARWHRRVLALTVPIILANLTQPILGAVDTAVAGHLPDPAYLGAVAAGGLFFNFVFWGFGFLRMGTTGLTAQAFGARNSVALLIQLFINAVNVAAVLLYVYVFDWCIAGIGAATATADACGFVLGAWLLWRKRPHALPPLRWATLVDTGALRRLVALNRDIFVRTLCLLTCFGWFAHAGAAQGDLVLAANALLLNFQTFMAYALDGFAHAAEALVGAAIGARQRDALRQAMRTTMVWGGLGALFFSLVYASGGEWIIGCLTDQHAVRDTAVRFLPWAAALPVISVWGFLFDGMFIGATRTRDLMWAMAISLAVFMLGTMTLPGLFGNDGLWASLLLFMAARGITLARVLPRIGAQLTGPTGAASRQRPCLSRPGSKSGDSSR